MLNINLLPDVQKERIHSKRIYLFVSSLVIPIIILVLAIIVLLLFLIQYLQTANKNLDFKVSQEQENQKKFDDVKDKVTQYNKNLVIATEVVNYQLPWANILNSFAGSVPGSIEIQEFNFDIKSNNNLIIRGKTSSNRAIMLFKVKLEDSKYFQKVNFNSVTDGIFDLNCQLENINLPAQLIQTQTPAPKGED